MSSRLISDTKLPIPEIALSIGLAALVWFAPNAWAAGTPASDLDTANDLTLATTQIDDLGIAGEGEDVAFETVGPVIRDSDTGKYYLVEDADESLADTDGFAGTLLRDPQTGATFILEN